MSRIALLSDVHGNLLALEAVLASAGHVDAIWVMGDTVGYGPDPSDSLALLQEKGARLVAGNHDVAVGTGRGLEAFNWHAAEAARIHRGWLSATERDALAALPQTLEADGFTLCHGSLRDPLWEYVFTSVQAQATLEIAPTPHCCNGHTHVPALYKLARRRAGPEGTGDDERRLYERSDYGSDDRRTAAVPFREGVAVKVSARMLVNPGSVGQPRDRDPRAAYAILDTEGGTIVLARSSYDVDETQRRIRARGLPGVLADRLAVGY